jgi:hypothetical protein
VREEVKVREEGNVNVREEVNGGSKEVAVKGGSEGKGRK